VDHWGVLVEAGARAQDGQILQEVFRRCDDFSCGVPQAGSSLGIIRLGGL